MSRLPAVLVLALVAALLGVPAASAAAPAPAGQGERAVGSREVRFDLVNTNDSPVPCLPGPDGEQYAVRARLVGPVRVVQGRVAVTTVNVLVHDAGTGGWFWNLRQHPTYDYATAMAAQGQTSLVLDRLGYDRSPLRNGEDTCLGAQVHMLHQVVQHLYAGRYEFTRGGGTTVHASKVVVHGHGTGATIARLEALEFSDTAGLVLMSPATSSPSAAALDAVRTQLTTCLGGATFAPYGASARAYQRLLFRTAPAAVRRLAVRQRNSTPCGDVTSLAAAVLVADREIDVPVLVLRGGADPRGGEVRSSACVVRRTFAGAGSALPLERAAPAVRRQVLGFVRSLPRSSR